MSVADRRKQLEELNLNPNSQRPQAKRAPPPPPPPPPNSSSAITSPPLPQRKDHIEPTLPPRHESQSTSNPPLPSRTANTASTPPLPSRNSSSSLAPSLPTRRNNLIKTVPDTQPTLSTSTHRVIAPLPQVVASTTSNRVVAPPPDVWKGKSVPAKKSVPVDVKTDSIPTRDSPKLPSIERPSLPSRNSSTLSSTSSLLMPNSERRSIKAPLPTTKLSSSSALEKLRHSSTSQDTKDKKESTVPSLNDMKTSAKTLQSLHSIADRSSDTSRNTSNQSKPTMPSFQDLKTTAKMVNKVNTLSKPLQNKLPPPIPHQSKPQINLSTKPSILTSHIPSAPIVPPRQTRPSVFTNASSSTVWQPKDINLHLDTLWFNLADLQPSKALIDIPGAAHACSGYSDGRKTTFTLNVLDTEKLEAHFITMEWDARLPYDANLPRNIQVGQRHEPPPSTSYTSSQLREAQQLYGEWVWNWCHARLNTYVGQPPICSGLVDNAVRELDQQSSHKPFVRIGLSAYGYLIMQARGRSLSEGGGELIFPAADGIRKGDVFYIKAGFVFDHENPYTREIIRGKPIEGPGHVGICTSFCEKTQILKTIEQNVSGSATIEHQHDMRLFREGDFRVFRIVEKAWGPNAPKA